jgi:hypothetical protein
MAIALTRLERRHGEASFRSGRLHLLPFCSRVSELTGVTDRLPFSD